MDVVIVADATPALATFDDIEPGQLLLQLALLPAQNLMLNGFLNATTWS